MRVIAVIPAYNEESTILEVIKQVLPKVTEVIVVDDGSKDNTRRLVKKAGVTVVSHAINRGLGAALSTGFVAAEILKADVVVTLDADGQHDPEELNRLVKAIEAGADVVIGSRMIDHKGMPWYRVLAQMLGNTATFILFGAWVTDSQSGFRAFKIEALKKMHLHTNRMEISSEIVAEIKRAGLYLVEVPITAIYTDYSLSKGQSWLVGLKTLIKLVIRRLTL